MANANDKCKAVIMSLLLDPPPILQAMLEVCARKVSVLPTDIRSKLPRTVAMAKTPGPPTPSNQQKRTQRLQKRLSAPNMPCYLCRQTEHWASHCPLKQQFTEFKNNVSREQKSPQINQSPQQQGEQSKKLEGEHGPSPHTDRNGVV